MWGVQEVVNVKKAPSFCALRGREAPSLCHRYVTKTFVRPLCCLSMLVAVAAVSLCAEQQAMHHIVLHPAQSLFTDRAGTASVCVAVRQKTHSLSQCIHLLTTGDSYMPFCTWIMSSGCRLLGPEIMTSARRIYSASSTIPPPIGSLKPVWRYFMKELLLGVDVILICLGL